MANKGYKGLVVNGVIARWYANITGHDLLEYQALARAIKENLTGPQTILEVASGPGYLSLELAKEPQFDVVGLDVSNSFTEIARHKALERHVSANFVRGDAAAMPFDDGMFDFVVCRAAFKNFSDPVQCLNEMHRVLRAGGAALIVDLRKGVTGSAVDAYVKKMGLPMVNALFVAAGLKRFRRWAYSVDQMEHVAKKSRFSTYHVDTTPMDFRLSLRK